MHEHDDGEASAARAQARRDEQPTSRFSRLTWAFSGGGRQDGGHFLSLMTNG
jgi:hypothetical protein